jgi:hypothetical protein
VSEEYTDLEHELRDLGPLMDEQARLEQSGPDPAFAVQLRARLVAQAAERAPARKRGWPLSLPRLTWQWGGLGAAVAVAAVVALILLRPGGSRSPGVSGGTKSALFVPPTPSNLEITKSYPILGGLGGGGGPIRPTQSRIELPAGQAYPGHLTLRGRSSTLSSSSPTGGIHAYRLQSAASIASRIKQMAGALGIHGSVRRMKDYDPLAPRSPNTIPPMVTWLVIEQGSALNERSIAVSTWSGAVVYHDLTLDTPQMQSEAPPSQRASEVAAHAWLKTLGWPADTMPPGPAYALSGPGATTITFGWSGVLEADRPSAVLLERHGGKIDEALLLPPIQAATQVNPRSVETALQQVRSGRAPVGVEHYFLTGPTAPGGTGTARSVAIEQVVTATSSGRVYLVPAYRFSGTVTLQGVAGARRWFALVPAT